MDANEFKRPLAYPVCFFVPYVLFVAMIFDNCMSSPRVLCGLARDRSFLLSHRLCFNSARQNVHRASALVTGITAPCADSPRENHGDGTPSCVRLTPSGFHPSWGKGRAEAQVVVPVLRSVPVAISGTTVPRVVVPAAAAIHAVRALWRRPGRVVTLLLKSRHKAWATWAVMAAALRPSSSCPMIS